MIYGLRYDPYVKRLPVKKDYTAGIQTFDLDNLYPQKAKEIVARTYTLKGIIDKLASFTNGEGFIDKSFNELVVNYDRKTGRKTTVDRLLNQVSYQFSWADGFAVHLSYNLNYKIAQVRAIPFEFCRFGLADVDGDVLKIKYSTNWEQEWSKGQRKILEYDIFNPDPEVVKNQIEQCGGILNYPGQILYWTPEESQYPKATFDPVFDQAQVQSEIGTYQLSDIQNGFSAGHFFVYPGQFQDDNERREFRQKLEAGKGSTGANSLLIIETGAAGADFDINKHLVKTDVQNNDRIREFTSKDVKNAMLEAFGFPKPILGIFPESGMFNQQEIKDAYDYTNTITSDRRKVMSEVFKQIFENFETPYNGNYDILPQQYLSGVLTQNSQQQPVQPSANSVLTNMTGRQNQNYKRMLREYESGKVTWKVAKLNLQSAFGFSDDEILTLLGDDPEQMMIANAG